MSEVGVGIRTRPIKCKHTVKHYCIIYRLHLGMCMCKCMCVHFMCKRACVRMCLCVIVGEKWLDISTNGFFSLVNVYCKHAQNPAKLLLQSVSRSTRSPVCDPLLYVEHFSGKVKTDVCDVCTCTVPRTHARTHARTHTHTHPKHTHTNAHCFQP